MKVSTYLTWVCKLKTVGANITVDGSIQNQLFNIGFVTMFLFNLSLVAMYAYMIFPHTAELSFNTILPVIMVLYYSTIVVINPILSTILLVQAGHLDLVGDAELSWLNGLVSLSISLLMAAALGQANWHLFGITVYGDVLLGLTVFMTSVHLFLLINNGLGIIHGFKAGCLQEIGKEMDPLEIENVCERYTQMKKSLSFYAFNSVMFGQFMLIASIYSMLLAPHISLLLLTFGLILQVAFIIKNMDDVYQEIKLIIIRGRKQARKSSARIKAGIYNFHDKKIKKEKQTKKNMGK